MIVALVQAQTGIICSSLSSPSPARGVPQIPREDFKAPHFEKYPQLHQLFNEATKLAGASGTKGSADAGTAEQLLAKIGEIDKIFQETKS